MRLGFLGLGNLGQHLASSLLRAGFPLTVHDRDEVAARPLLDAGAAWASSPRDVAAASDSVFTCLPSPRAVDDVVAGESGLLGGMRAGGTWIDTSTNNPHELQRLAALAAAAGVSCLEAPVTGGVHLAASGQITVLVGGDAEVWTTVTHWRATTFPNQPIVGYESGRGLRAARRAGFATVGPLRVGLKRT